MLARESLEKPIAETEDNTNSLRRLESLRKKIDDLLPQIVTQGALLFFEKNPDLLSKALVQAFTPSEHRARYRMGEARKIIIQNIRNTKLTLDFLARKIGISKS